MESEMIKCKNGGCPNGKEVCCFFCEEKDTCKQSCDSAALSDPAKCEEAIIEGDALELFRCESALALSIISGGTASWRAVPLFCRIARREEERLSPFLRRRCGTVPAFGKDCRPCGCRIKYIVVKTD